MSDKRKHKKSRKTLTTKEILRSIEARKRRRKYYLLAVLVLIAMVIVIITATRTQPQTGPTGNLMVHIVDPAGNIIHGAATITISGPYTTSTSVEHGVYAFQSIPVGSYSVTVNAPGYKQGSQTVTVNADDTEHLNVILSPS